MFATHHAASLGALCLTVTAVTAAPAQTVLQTLTPPPGLDEFGRTIAAPGDITGDGIPDLVVSSVAHEIRAYSGADWSLHTVLSAPSFAANFGIGLAALGDVDGDGLGDYAIAQPTTSNFSGTVAVISGRAGSEIRRYEGDPGDFLGAAIGSVGDIDGDGVQDLAARALKSLNGSELECVLVWSGSSGAQLLRIDAPALGISFGSNVAGVGDVDGDGFDDLSFSVLGPGMSGFEVRSGASGALLFDFVQTSGLPRFWGSPARLGDIDGDLRDDFAVVTFSGPVFEDKSLWIVSATGALLVNREAFGASLRLDTVEDLDGDGVPDLLLGAPLAGGGRGSLTLRSGRTGELLATYEGPLSASQYAEWALAIGDVNGDGRADFAVNDLAGSGTVRVLSGAAIGPLERSCVATPNSTGAAARMDAAGSLSVLDAELRLTVSGLPPDAFALFARGAVAASLPFGDGLLCISPFSGGLVRMEVVRTDAGGIAETTAVYGPSAPGTEVVVGSTWSFQLLYRDPSGGPAGFNGSDALRGTFVP